MSNISNNKKYVGVFSLITKNNAETYKNKHNRKKPWMAQLTHKGVKWHGKARVTEREAALDYDFKRIELGLEPVNILKKRI